MVVCGLTGLAGGFADWRLVVWFGWIFGVGCFVLGLLRYIACCGGFGWVFGGLGLGCCVLLDCDLGGVYVGLLLLWYFGCCGYCAVFGLGFGAWGGRRLVLVGW